MARPAEEAFRRATPWPHLLDNPPATDSPELRAIAGDWRQRVADFETFRNAELRSLAPERYRDHRLATVAETDARQVLPGIKAGCEPAEEAMRASAKPASLSALRNHHDALMEGRAMLTPVSFKDHIMPLFRPPQVMCMNDRGVFLHNYEWMSNPANAMKVCQRLKTDKVEDKMPPNGPYWTETDIALFEKWMDDGFHV